MASQKSSAFDSHSHLQRALRGKSRVFTALLSGHTNILNCVSELLLSILKIKPVLFSIFLIIFLSAFIEPARAALFIPILVGMAISGAFTAGGAILAAGTISGIGEVLQASLGEDALSVQQKLINCWFCDVVPITVDYFSQYSLVLSDYFVDPVRFLLVLFLAFWFLFQALKAFLPFGPSLDTSAWNSMFIRIAISTLIFSIVYKGSTFIWEYFIIPVLSIGLSIGGAFLPQNPSGSNVDLGQTAQISVLSEYSFSIFGIKKCSEFTAAGNQYYGLTTDVFKQTQKGKTQYKWPDGTVHNTLPESGRAVAETKKITIPGVYSVTEGNFGGILHSPAAMNISNNVNLSPDKPIGEFLTNVKKSLLCPLAVFNYATSSAIGLFWGMAVDEDVSDLEGTAGELAEGFVFLVNALSLGLITAGMILIVIRYLVAVIDVVLRILILVAFAPLILASAVFDTTRKLFFEGMWGVVRSSFRYIFIMLSMVIILIILAYTIALFGGYYGGDNCPALEANKNMTVVLVANSIINNCIQFRGVMLGFIPFWNMAGAIIFGMFIMNYMRDFGDQMFDAISGGAGKLGTGFTGKLLQTATGAAATAVGAGLMATRATTSVVGMGANIGGAIGGKIATGLSRSTNAASNVTQAATRPMSSVGGGGTSPAGMTSAPGGGVSSSSTPSSSIPTAPGVSTGGTSQGDPNVSPSNVKSGGKAVSTTPEGVTKSTQTSADGSRSKTTYNPQPDFSDKKGTWPSSGPKKGPTSPGGGGNGNP